MKHFRNFSLAFLTLILLAAVFCSCDEMSEIEREPVSVSDSEIRETTVSKTQSETGENAPQTGTETEKPESATDSGSKGNNIGILPLD